MKKDNSPREVAYEALLAVERDGMQSHIVLQRIPEKNLDPRDRAFVLRLVEGTVEYRLQLDWVIDQFSKTKTAKMRPGIREILRMAVYQILYMDSVPDRAAVSEAVDLAVRKGFGGLRGFVNGVLRTIVREKDHLPWPERPADPADRKFITALSVQYSVSEEILAAWLPRFGAEKTEAVCKAFLEDRPLTVHWFGDEMNPAPGDDEICLKSTKILLGSYFLMKGTDPAKLAGFREGRLYVQDLSSQIAIAAAGIKPGDRVIDLCAAPGGKSFLAAEQGAQVLARDLTEEKAARIRENAGRLHLQERVRVQAADASIFDPELEDRFDVVIADLPCSGFGVAGRKPEIKYKPYRDTVRPLAELQKKILANAVRYVRPGGKLLYSTCTIAVEENEDNVRWLLDTYGARSLKQHPSDKRRSILEPAEISLPVGIYSSCDEPFFVQLLPSDGPWDGFFFSLFRKVEIPN